MRLHGETEAAARDRYRHYLQQSLACIHPSAYFFFGKQPLAAEWALSTDPAPIPLHDRDGHEIFLTATQSFTMRKDKGEWRVSTREYIYNVSDSEDTRSYMFAWHWHPNQRPECHLHVNAELANGMKLHRRHVPTARVSFEEVLRFLIEECGIEPNTHSNWRTVLHATQERHEKHRTWWGSRRP